MCHVCYMYAVWCYTCPGENNSTEALPVRSVGGEIYVSMQNILISFIIFGLFMCSSLLRQHHSQSLSLGQIWSLRWSFVCLKLFLCLYAYFFLFYREVSGAFLCMQSPSQNIMMLRLILVSSDHNTQQQS